MLAGSCPYTAYSTGLTILLPAEALGGGTAEMLKRLADVAERARIRWYLEQQIAQDAGEPSLIVIGSDGSSTAPVGRGTMLPRPALNPRAAATV